jgi:hypothetical protein
MDDMTSVRSYLQQDGVDFKGCFYYALEKLSCIIIVRTPLLSFIFIRSFIVVIFNVSNTKLTHLLDFLDTSSMGVTFGIRAGRFRSCLGSLNYN